MLSGARSKISEAIESSRSVKVNLQYVGNGAIERPHNSWVNIFELEQEHGKRLCLNYKIPYKNNFGQLRLKEAETNGTCSFFDQKDSLANIEIHRLLVEYGPQKAGRFEGASAYDISFLYKGKEVLWHGINLNKNEQKKKFARYQSLNEGSFYLGDLKKLVQEKQGMKDWEGGLKICHKINRDCEEEFRNECHKCPVGIFEVAGSGCEQRTKICGIRLCGQRNLPACFSGISMSERLKKNDCFPGSRAGFCAEGLRTFCNDEGFLICL